MAARIYNAAARLQKNPFRSPQGIALLQRSLALARQHNDRPLQAEVLRHLGEATHDDDLQVAEAFFKESLRISRELNDAEQEGWTTLGLGSLAAGRGDPLTRSAATSTAWPSLCVWTTRLLKPWCCAISPGVLNSAAITRRQMIISRARLRCSTVLACLQVFLHSSERGRLACQRGDTSARWICCNQCTIARAGRR